MPRKTAAHSKSGKPVVGIIGLGYVGLPLVIRFAEEGIRVIGFDVDPGKIEVLRRGQSYIRHIPPAKIAAVLPRLSLTTDMGRLREPDAIIVCVPTPLDHHLQPDLTYLEKTARDIAHALRPGQLICVESTTYPGTTREVFLAPFERKGLKAGKDFFLVFSPEREDPANPAFTTRTIPKLVGGITPRCRQAGVALYSLIIDRVIAVSSPEVAESSKLLENIYRGVNIALVNELKLLFDRMGIDVWEVIDAAKTKPFGFHAFYPGPGLGGHCIPIDPFYLTWKAREYDFHTRFIELAGEINSAMPYHVVEKLVAGLNQQGKSIRNARILLVGLAYKKNVDDIRESPSFAIWKLLLARHARVDYYDPYVPKVERTRQFPTAVSSVRFAPRTLRRFAAAIIVTDHDCIDYAALARNIPLIVDTRRAYKKHRSNVVRA